MFAARSSDIKQIGHQHGRLRRFEHPHAGTFEDDGVVAHHAQALAVAADGQRLALRQEQHREVAARRELGATGDAAPAQPVRAARAPRHDVEVDGGAVVEDGVHFRLALELHDRIVFAQHEAAFAVDGQGDAGAVAGLCPTTEANLGDGLFPLAGYLAAGGRFGIGSDSHVSQSPVEELRLLEYGQRLRHQCRNVAVSDRQRSVGDFLWQGALAGGAQASGRRVGALTPGKRADLLVLDDAHPNLHGAALADVLGTLVFCGNDNLVKDVMVGGRWVVRDHQHFAQAAIAQRYIATLAALRAFRP